MSSLEEIDPLVFRPGDSTTKSLQLLQDRIGRGPTAASAGGRSAAAALQPIADRIEAYWLGKSGSRSLPAFEALVEELGLILRKGGRSGVQELLRHASQAGWPVINGLDAVLSHV